MPRPIVPSNLVRPTLETRYHIDYDWWARSSRDLEMYMAEHLCEMHRTELAKGSRSTELIDWVDPETGQVRQVDSVNYALLRHCSQQPDYVTERTSLVDVVFRVLLAAGNRPMTPVELADRTGRSAETILKTLSGEKIYRGLRPYIGDEQARS